MGTYYISPFTIGLLSPEVVAASQKKPIWADLSGAMMTFENLKATVSEIRSQITEKAEILRALQQEKNTEESLYLSKVILPIIS